ncbi:hypothetical protein BH11PAT4_BH11PAT4_5430 [soil metagenome]
METEEPKVPTSTPASEPTSHSTKPRFAKRTLVIGGVAAVLVLAAGAFAVKGAMNDRKVAESDRNRQAQQDARDREESERQRKIAEATPFPSPTFVAPSPIATPKVFDPLSNDPVEVGKYLSHDACVNEGSKKLNHPYMMPSDLGIIVPMGLTAGGHVTPVDHQYYFGKNISLGKDAYNVYAPSDGTLVDVQVRPKAGGGADYRGVISYSCTFFSYFDLATSLDTSITSQLPAGWETKSGPQAVKIALKEGQVIAKVGGQSLDIAVWDTTKKLTKLLVPKAYANLEPWKMHTVKPLDYYTDSLKAQVLPLYARSVEPRDGVLDYDVDGFAVGNWFKKGTNGYIGAFTETTYNSDTYADGHLSIASDLYDPKGWIFSTGAVAHGTQYAIKAPSVAPDALDQSKGLVKYTLVQIERKDQTGKSWVSGSIPTSLTLDTNVVVKGVALVQVTGTREMKVEVFPGKTAAQVSAFTSAAITYTRGDEATTMENK